MSNKIVQKIVTNVVFFNINTLRDVESKIAFDKTAGIAKMNASSSIFRIHAWFVRRFHSQSAGDSD